LVALSAAPTCAVLTSEVHTATIGWNRMRRLLDVFFGVESTESPTDSYRSTPSSRRQSSAQRSLPWRPLP
jgi:hypothetical protein